MTKEEIDYIMKLVIAYGSECRQNGGLSDRAIDFIDAIRAKLEAKES